MRAALLEAPGRPLAVVDDIDVDDPHVGEVRVRVTHCGVCHSDLSVVDGTFPAGLPIVLGHEAAGVVESIGPGVTSLAVGDHVVLTPAAPCGRCYWCVRDEHSLCVNAQAIMTNTFADGTTRLSRGGELVFRGLGVGAFGELVVTQETGAIRIPPDVPLETACVIGCAVQTGIGAVVNTAHVEAGATVLVVGLGGVGLAAVQGARLAGAARVIVSDPVATRREAAIRFGATDLVDPTEDDLLARVMSLTDVGVDYAFDTVGRGTVVETCLTATRSGGTTVCVGAPPLEDVITIAPAALFAATGKRLVGCLLGSCDSLRDIPRFVDLWQAGRLDLEAMVTTRRPLAEINEAFADLRVARGIRTVLEL
ncbi:MAG: Zn-dependent alcohol dehydrogenase [Acidimicrobiia bacterium]